jgi:hypothetical protein
MESIVEPCMESIVEPGMVSAVEPGIESIVEPGIEVSESSGHVHSGFDFCISGGYVEHQSGTTHFVGLPEFMESIVGTSAGEPGMESVVVSPPSL